VLSSFKSIIKKDPEEAFHKKSKTFPLNELHIHVAVLSNSGYGVSVFAGKH